MDESTPETLTAAAVEGAGRAALGPLARTLWWFRVLMFRRKPHRELDFLIGTLREITVDAPTHYYVRFTNADPEGQDSETWSDIDGYRCCDPEEVPHNVSAVAYLYVRDVFGNGEASLFKAAGHEAWVRLKDGTIRRPLQGPLMKQTIVLEKLLRKSIERRTIFRPRAPRFSIEDAVADMRHHQRGRRRSWLQMNLLKWKSRKRS